MNPWTFVKRGFGLIRVGNAVRKVKLAEGEANKLRAHQFLVSLLGKSRGLQAKVGQFMTMGEDDLELRETLNDSVPAIPFDKVVSIIESAYGKPWKKVFKSFDREGKPASLGQVHFARLNDGRKVAVKVQYPEIRGSVESEMKILGLLPNVGPAARWGFDTKGYRDVFWDNFSEEMDYETEANHQEQYRNLAVPLNDLIIPEIIRDHCFGHILVQSLEEGFTLDKAETMDIQDRNAMGKAILRHYFYMIFCQGFVHADPNPGNFAFKKVSSRNYSLIIYDFGCVLKLEDTTRLALVRIILALRTREALDPVSCLTALGFDSKKLQDLRPKLPALLNILFEPFLDQAPYRVKDWNLGERIDRLAGELKWWFRSSAPPKMIFLMRTLHGLTTMLSRLDCKVSWLQLFDELCGGDQFIPARQLSLPEPEFASDAFPKFDGISQYLKVYVEKPNGNKVRLTMPARVIEDLEEVIDPPVMETIKRQKIDLDVIKKDVIASGFTQQVVFEVRDDERYVKVWLE